MPDGARLEQTGRELIQQRLEGVVVVPVDEHDLRIGFLELVRGADPGEASAEDDHAGSSILCVHSSMAPIQGRVPGMTRR